MSSWNPLGRKASKKRYAMTCFDHLFKYYRDTVSLDDVLLILFLQNCFEEVQIGSKRAFFEGAQGNIDIIQHWEHKPSDTFPETKIAPDNGWLED